MLPVLLVIVFIVVPVAELYVIIQVGGSIGVLPTIGLLVLDSIVGSLLLGHQGRATWRRFNGALSEGRVPTREVADGALVIFGGAMLLTPGFLTDILGLVLLIPPTRAVVRTVLLKWAGARMAIAVGGPAGGATYAAAGAARGMHRRRRARSPRDDYDVEGTAVEVDTRHLDR